MAIKVEISMNRMGHLLLSPVSQRIRDRLTRYLDRAGARDPDPTVYLQVDTDVASFLAELPPDVRRDIDQGWTRVVLMDPWLYGCYVGWDAGDRCDQWA